MMSEPKQANTTLSNDAEAIAAAYTGVALYDRTHWGRIEVSDADRLRFLHNQTTNAFETRKPGQGCDTVFVTSTGRTIDLATAYILDESVLLLVSPGQQQTLIPWMDRYIFFADKVSLKDLTPTTTAFSLLGPQSQTTLSALGLPTIEGEANATHAKGTLEGVPICVAVGSGLTLPGYTLIIPTEAAEQVWRSLLTQNAVPLGEQAWEQLRIRDGRPRPGHELTEDYNPLETGLWHTISLTKGCYIGQETIARLHTYRGVKQQLWGLKLEGAAEPETIILQGEDKVGKLTSITQTAEGYFGLGYIRTKVAAPNLALQVGDTKGTLVAVPFVSHEYL
jgi:tRNA-modifying protein YgfZ